METLLEFTAGHLFPFVTFAQHVLNPSNKIDLNNIDDYLSGKEFRSSREFIQVRARCFDFLFGNAIIKKPENLLLNKCNAGDELALQKLGVWLVNRFLSPLLTTEVFLRAKLPDGIDDIDDIILDETQKTPYAQQIILAGLQNMAEEDFKDARYDQVPTENVVGFKWGFNVRKVLPNVRIYPQIRTKYAEHFGRGAKPLIDFVCNGRVNTGIEIALNLSKSGIFAHLERFNKDYARYSKNGAVLHFETNSRDAPDKDDARLYTFVKKRNELYRGSSLVQSNVARKLRSHPVRSYSTTVRLGMDLVKRVVNGCR
jgi:hypothetical protein